MPYFLIFTAGIFIGSNWSKIKKVIAPHVGKATEQFDAVYSQMAQKVGQKYEDFEDRVAEKRYHAGGNNSDSKDL